MAGRGRIEKPVTIREYHDSDELPVIALFRELQSAELPFNDHLKPPEDIGGWYINRLKESCATLAGVILLAMKGEDCLGCAVVFTAMKEKGEDEELAYTYAHVSELVVAKKAQRLGIAKLLLTECEQRAKEAGRAEMTLAVHAGNEPALCLYRSSGYADIKIRMRKKLQ